MEHSPATGTSDRSAGGSTPFQGLLAPEGSDGTLGTAPADLSFVSDLNLDQVIGSAVRALEERDLITDVFHRQLRDPDVVLFRHEVFRDLEDQALLSAVKDCSARLQRARWHLGQLGQMSSEHQRNGWFLDAVAGYCEAVLDLRAALGEARVSSRALLGLRSFLDGYCSSSEFAALASATRDRKEELAQVNYNVRIDGGWVTVSRYEGEADYSAEVLRTFDRFQQGAVRDYRVKYRAWPPMDHIGEKILELVARLYSDEFVALDAYCRRYRDFFDPGVRRFEREVQFYLAYLAHIAPLRQAGLPFCYPEVGRSKEIFATGTFDIALADKLLGSGQKVVCNDFHLSSPERIFVVSGPNQGGKTTFARAFGQLHHLASIGCPVPGSEARLYLFDRLFTHFERAEDLSSQRGKLEDDLVRIRAALLGATPDSIIVLNEIFSSTTLRDSRFLGRKVLAKMVELDLLGVYVTFVDELASLGPSVVSMVAKVLPDDPARRTFEIVRGPANGLAYALAIAEKHGVTYACLRQRLQR